MNIKYKLYDLLKDNNLIIYTELIGDIILKEKTKYKVYDTNFNYIFGGNTQNYIIKYINSFYVFKDERLKLMNLIKIKNKKP